MSGLNEILGSLTVEEYDADYNGVKYMRHKITGKRKAKQAIKDLMLDIIGRDSRIGDEIAENRSYDNERTCNQLRSEQRKRLEEL